MRGEGAKVLGMSDYDCDAPKYRRGTGEEGGGKFLYVF
jgi:hypothetical protein